MPSLFDHETPKFSHILTPFQFPWHDDADSGVHLTYQQNHEMVLFFDGQNDAPQEEGGWGFWLGQPDDDGAPLEIFGACGPVMPGVYSTNNTAEFHGLYYGLAALQYVLDETTYHKTKQSKTLRIYGDSQLAINLFAKRWKGKKPHLQVFARRCQELAKQLPFETITAEWIPREQNDLADRLSNQGRALLVK